MPALTQQPDWLRAHEPEPVPTRADDLPDVYDEGRRCAEPGCITRLCQYNAGPYCFCHAARHEDVIAALSEAA